MTYITSSLVSDKHVRIRAHSNIWKIFQDMRELSENLTIFGLKGRGRCIRSVFYLLSFLEMTQKKKKKTKDKRKLKAQTLLIELKLNNY